jgi:hypothetical protein
MFLYLDWRIGFDKLGERIKHHVVRLKPLISNLTNAKLLVILGAMKPCAGEFLSLASPVILAFSRLLFGVLVSPSKILCAGPLGPPSSHNFLTRLRCSF